MQPRSPQKSLDVVNGYSLDSIGLDLPEEAGGTACDDGVTGRSDPMPRSLIRVGLGLLGFGVRSGGVAG